LKIDPHLPKIINKFQVTYYCETQCILIQNVMSSYNKVKYAYAVSQKESHFFRQNSVSHRLVTYFPLTRMISCVNLTDRLTSTSADRGLICMGTVGNYFPTLSLQWEHSSHISQFQINKLQ